jgi:hypothetical protein
MLSWDWAAAPNDCACLASPGMLALVSDSDRGSEIAAEIS